MLKRDLSGSDYKNRLSAVFARLIHSTFIEPLQSSKKINSPGAISSSSSDSDFESSVEVFFCSVGMKEIIAATSSGYLSLDLRAI